MCVQVNPGHGDFRECVGLYPGREDKAVRPSQQSALQAVQTGKMPKKAFKVCRFKAKFVNQFEDKIPDADWMTAAANEERGGSTDE